MDDLAEKIRQLHIAGPTLDQRRRTPRTFRPGELVIRLVNGSDLSRPMKVQFRDGSAGGIGFVSRQAMIPSTRLVVTISDPVKGELQLCYEVVRCKQIGRNKYNVGARFVREK